MADAGERGAQGLASHPLSDLSCDQSPECPARVGPSDAAACPEPSEGLLSMTIPTVMIRRLTS